MKVQGKELAFTKQQLVNLYEKQRLSLNEIGKRYGCGGTNILYWMKKYKIPRRKSPHGVFIDPVLLKKLYWNSDMSSEELGNFFGVNARTIRKKLKNFGIKRKTVSQALTVKKKKKWSGTLKQKAYLLGLRTGDFHAKLLKKTVRVQTSTTHPALKKLLKMALGQWGEYREYYSKDHRRCDEWFIYIDLHESFDWIVDKPQEIPQWILENNEYFYAYLAAYIDCEGSICVIKNRQHVRLMLGIRTGDRTILEQINKKLSELGYTSHIYESQRRGEPVRRFGGTLNVDIDELKIYKQKDLLRLYQKLLSNSLHDEKIAKYWFSLKFVWSYWKDINARWNKLILGIKEKVLVAKSEK